MTRTTLPLALATLAIAAMANTALAAQAPNPNAPPVNLKPATWTHLVAAQQAARDDFPAPLNYCNQIQPAARIFIQLGNGALRTLGGPPGQPPEPAKIFDNMYYLGGVRNVNAYAVDTPDGLVIIDAMNNSQEASTLLVDNLRKLGLDPARIKHVVITHGHGDHYGGGKYLQETYKARVYMGEEDWWLAANRPPEPGGPARAPAPTKDVVITEGMKLPGGISLHLTPGHTLGTATLLIPVTDNGQKHLVAFHGGSGFDFYEGRTAARFKMYADTNERFMNLALAAGADVPLSNHAENDLVIVKADKLKQRKAGEANPFIMGQDGVRRLFTGFIECARAFQTQMSN